jgi:hypothetical protein
MAYPQLISLRLDGEAASLFPGKEYRRLEAHFLVQKAVIVCLSGLRGVH